MLTLISLGQKTFMVDVIPNLQVTGSVHWKAHLTVSFMPVYSASQEKVSTEPFPIKSAGESLSVKCNIGTSQVCVQENDSLGLQQLKVSDALPLDVKRDH